MLQNGKRGHNSAIIEDFITELPELIPTESAARKNPMSITSKS